ncbi:MAG: GspE/PulE family protein [Gammaproteobacteria bacterium]
MAEEEFMNDVAEDSEAEATVPLGERLLEKRVLSDDQLRIALFEQQSSREPLGRVLVRLGFVTEATIRDLLSESGNVSTVDLTKITVDSEVLAMIPLDVAKQYNVFPVAYRPENKTIVIAVANPNDFVLADQIRAFLGGDYELEFMVSEESAISRAVDEYYGLELTIEGILKEIEMGEDAAGGAGGDTSSNPIVRLVNAFLNDAVKRGASDIHFEPEESFLRVRYRIDGVLRQIRSLHRSYWDSMAVRLKVISEMNIAESRVSQDGRISFTLYGRVVDFRVASQPTTHGENFVLRILDQQRNVTKMDNLGINEKSMNLVNLILGRPNGVIMVTGPTGSGKTTTLYSVIQHLNTEKVNIMTLEDPVEYPLPMIRQTPVGESGKMTWALGIKSLLRQDPDIILVGEVRETDTAEQVFRAAMTGHLVLTTLHTNDAISVIPRLQDMGVLPDIMATNISGVIAQRLVRKLCPQCKKRKEELTAEEKMVIGYFVPDVEKNLDKYQMHEAVGCPSCDHQGFRGRAALMEILRFNDDLDEVVARRGTAKEVKTVAEKGKVFVSMAENGVDKILQGETSLSELARVTDVTAFYPVAPTEEGK